ncbi:hypothetical protein IWX90DRAFT_445473, partial [Phyllosticta citrichinensis]
MTGGTAGRKKNAMTCNGKELMWFGCGMCFVLFVYLSGLGRGYAKGVSCGYDMGTVFQADGISSFSFSFSFSFFLPFSFYLVLWQERTRERSRRVFVRRGYDVCAGCCEAVM